MADLFNKNEFEYMDFLEYQELDRKRIANELHDTSLQDLTHIIHQIELSSLYIDVDTIKARLELEDVNNQLRRIIQDIRNTIFDLRPMSFDDLGLSQAIYQYIDFVKKKYNIDMDAEMDNIDYLDEKKKLVLYRIIQECLLNSAKHADAHKVNLILNDKENEIEISISDDGIGIDHNKREEEDLDTHYGLMIVKDRVAFLHGDFYITSTEGEGTNIIIKIPKTKGVLYEN